MFTIEPQCDTVMIHQEKDGVLTRREFNTLAGSLAAGLVLKPAGAWAEEQEASAEALKLYQASFVLDCNTLASIGAVPANEREELVKAVRESGVTAVKSTLGGATGTFEDAVADIAAADQLIEDRPEVLLKVRTIAELKRCKPEHRMGVIYSFEAASPLGDQLDRIALFRGLGVRVMQLCYNRKSPFGVGCLDGETGGLTDLGLQAIAKMNELGVAVDLSHANTQTTAEGIAASKKPPVITHAGCRAVYMHPRNKEDRELKALADKGGVIGIYMLPFLTASPKQPMLADYMQHMEHALKVCGEEHVGVGSDVPFESFSASDIKEVEADVAKRKAAGVSAPGEDRPPYIPDLNTPRKMELIADALLKRGYSARTTEKVLGANFVRVFGEIWTVLTL
jgi:membrane dipeptidase